MRSFFFLAIVLASVNTARAQETRYVTDSLKLEARSAPGVRQRIVRMLESGSRVQVLESNEGWSRVITEGGTEAWILDRYLMSEPPARGQLAAARASLEAAQTQLQSLRAELETLRTTNRELESSRDSFVEQAQSVASELTELKRTAASSVQLRNQNRALQQEVNSLSTQLDSLTRDFTVLRDGRSRDWFIAGAGVLLGGMLLGLVIPKIRWKRRRGWGEL